MLYPVIDIGSNTVKVAVLDEDNLFARAPVFFKAAPLSLRSKISGGSLEESAVCDLCDLVKDYVETARRLTPVPPIAFATASLRGLNNAEEIKKRLEETAGVRVQIISGETEAYYSFLGARGSFPVKAGLSVDLGGGSTEILAFQKNKVIASVSLPFGCLTLYQKFFESEKADFEGCCQLIRHHLSLGAPSMPGKCILLSGGSAKAVLKYKNILEEKKSSTIGTRQFKRIRHHFESGDPKQKNKIASILKDRYRLVLPAIAVFSEIAHFYGRDQVFVCRCGVREGCLFETLEKNKKV